jgi:hypothetical protein
MTTDTNLDPLILDLLEWIAREPHTYAEVIEVWRTSCPRLTVWEDCVDRGFAERGRQGGREAAVEITTAGRAFMQAHGRNLAPARRNGPVHPSL